ncbi:MAG: PAS domain-containing sensor histidine kinase [Pseudomonadales bacterium]|nr:PAS domain-containing sensor histidine kinase [Pseudomonadales bacterium]
MAGATDATQVDNFELSLQRSTILRVYNYYRIFLSFLFLFLFLSENLKDFVGSANPELFQHVVIGYIVGNVLIGIGTLFASTSLLSRTTPSFVILIADIICLTLLMFASGGVDSGLGNFLIFAVAFGGGLILGRVSTVLPAIAFILTLYSESYLFFLNQSDAQAFFQAGVLGMVYFVANMLFQTLAQRLRSRETEVFTLEKINQIIVNQMRTGVVVVDPLGKIRLINQAAKRYLSIPMAPNLEEERLPYRLLDKLNEWKHEPHLTSLTFHTQDSSPELIANFSPLATPDPESDTLIFVEDSTDVQRQAQQLKLASLGRLSASIAHEIRNPLGAISHAAQLLGESTDLSRGDSRLAEIIQSHCVRLNDVIENVLQMSRRRSADPKEVVLGVWISQFIEEFSAGLNEPGKVDVNIDPPDIRIRVDPLHLSQVLGNLCQNGLRYSKKKTGEARVKIEGGIDKDTGNPYLDVIDYGEGIDGEHLANLFEPFYTTETSGTGLGLYLSKELCEANNARLGYRRAQEGGACFHISFFQQTRD